MVTVSSTASLFKNVTSTVAACLMSLILSVDDREDSLLLNSLIIDSLGYSSITAADGQTALKLAQKAQPSLILLDVALPDIDGLEVLHRLKQNFLTSAIPVIAVTAMAMKDEREQILAAGFDDYLSKPYMLEDLENIICCYLNHKPQILHEKFA